MRTWPRPAAVTGQALVLAAMAGAVNLISRTTGSGWLLVLFSGLVAVLVLGAVLPALGLAGVELSAGAPGDATVGRPVTVTVSAGGRVWPARLRLAEPPGGPVGVGGPSAGDVVVVPRRRGVVGHVDVELRSAAPFGLVWWRRPVPVALRRPLHVGPEPLACDPPGWQSGPRRGAAGGGVASDAGDTVRAVREHVDGDPLRLVSWPATARHGRIMVKDLEAAATVGLAIVVDLLGSEERAEEAAGRAAGLANAALAEGVPVVLVTSEESGPCTGPVASPVEVGRRLARAVPGALRGGPAPGGGIVVRVAAT